MSDRTAFFTGKLVYDNNQPTEVYALAKNRQTPNNNINDNNNMYHQQSDRISYNSSAGSCRNLYDVDGVNNKTNDTTRFIFFKFLLQIHLVQSG